MKNLPLSGHISKTVAHHVQENTTLQVHLWKKRQFRFIQLNNQVKNLYTFIFLHFELELSFV